MSCCPNNVIFFANVATSLIMYSAGMVDSFGAKPRVDVYYYDPDTADYYTDNGTPASGTLIKFSADSILINHGGLSSGYIKIS